MKISSVLYALVLFCIIAQCASSSKASDQKSEEAKMFTTVEGKSVVYLYRPGKAIGAAVSTQVKVNGIDAGGMGPGTFFRWELKPGNYAFSCFSRESSSVSELEVKANEQYFIQEKVGVGVADVRLTLSIEPEKTGINGVKKCKLLVSSYRQE